MLLPRGWQRWQSSVMSAVNCRSYLEVLRQQCHNKSIFKWTCFSDWLPPVLCLGRVWRREIHFFRGPAVAPAVLQVFALLRLAGGLRLLPWPRSDSVHGLQQRRLTSTDRNLQWPRHPATPPPPTHCWHQQIKSKKKTTTTTKVQKTFQTSALHLNTAASHTHRDTNVRNRNPFKNF